MKVTYNIVKVDVSLHILCHRLLVCQGSPQPETNAVWGEATVWKSLGTPLLEHRGGEKYKQE